MKNKRCLDCKKFSEYRRCPKCVRIRAKFRVTPATIQKLKADQGYGCAICGNLNGTRDFAIDHDHDTEKIRGLLCTRCNLGIGYLRTSELLRRAANYLEKDPPNLRYLPERTKLQKIDDKLFEEEYLKVLADNSFTSRRGQSRIIAGRLNIHPDRVLSRIRRLKP